ncbi:hypothetical protein [Sulfitobacter pontiacus]|uniref:hypothetical protein n=1 Tax=Sulfitobacter pontiacus TaxID=60137 RepID=UPI0030EBB88D
MKPLLPALLLSLGFSTAAVQPAADYPVDCAILLCLAGGWPGSAECSQARAVFIRRITPWPIEPPLQIWNCPMRVGFPKSTDLERLFDIRANAPKPEWSWLPPTREGPVQRVVNQADVDISDPAFDFVRSIRVFEITFRMTRSGDDNCSSSAAFYEGSYGSQGDYQRKRSDPSAVPAASDFRMPVECRNYRYRSVFVEWRDYMGSYGSEEVHY